MSVRVGVGQGAGWDTQGWLEAQALTLKERVGYHPASSEINNWNPSRTRRCFILPSEVCKISASDSTGASTLDMMDDL